MRPGILVATLLAGLAALLVVALLNPSPPHAPDAGIAPPDSPTPPESAPVASPSSSSPASPPPSAAAELEAGQTPPLPAGNASLAALTPTVPPDPADTASYQAYLQARFETLEELSLMDDAPSLDAILGELKNRDPRVRHAALEATVQFGSRDAIPVLQALAAETESPSEKAQLEEAVEFLELPSLTELRERLKQRRTAP